MKYRSVEICGGIRDISLLGLGMGCAQDVPEDELEHIIRHALVNGINYIDLCAGRKDIFAPVGRAIRNVRSGVILQAHFGAGFDELGQYEWIRDFEKIRDLFRWQLQQLGTDHVEIGIIHLADDEEDVELLKEGGILNYARDLKQRGTVRSLGFSTHSVKTAEALMDIGIFDVVMLPVNVRQSRSETAEIKRFTDRCMHEGVCAEAVGVFGGGRFIDGRRMPGRKSYTKEEHLTHPLKMPGVASVVVGVRSIAETDELISMIG